MNKFRGWKQVFSFTYGQNLKSKSYIAVTILIAVILFGLTTVLSVLAAKPEEPETEPVSYAKLQRANAKKAALLEKQIASCDLLIIDEMSYLTFNRHQSELLFKVISDRSEKSSTIVTTNLPFSKWTELFENTTMVAALIDRLTFRSHVLDMNGDSYRLKATMQKQT